MAVGKASATNAAPLELYDLRADAAEERNVAAAHPDIVTRIEAYLKTAREDSANWPLREPPPVKAGGKK